MDALENLLKIKQLKKEPADSTEIENMLLAAQSKLRDAQLPGLSKDSQFTLAYGAAYALALSALRWHGYRAENRYVVFQCLQHTVNLSAEKWRVFDKCHNCRNLAEYEGCLDIADALMNDLLRLTIELEEKLNQLLSNKGIIYDKE